MAACGKTLPAFFGSGECIGFGANDRAEATLKLRQAKSPSKKSLHSYGGSCRHFAAPQEAHGPAARSGTEHACRRTRMQLDYDMIVIGSGPAGRRAADPGGQARQVGAGGREGPPGRRRLGAHRHDPLEDAARDRAEPDRLARARLLRPRLPGQAGHRGRGPDGAAAQDARPRGRCAGAPVRPQRACKHVRGTAASSIRTGSRSPPTTARSQVYRRRAVPDRRRHAAVPPGYVPFNGAHGARQRRDRRPDRRCRAA